MRSGRCRIPSGTAASGARPSRICSTDYSTGWRRAPCSAPCGPRPEDGDGIDFVTFLRALGRGIRSFWLMLGITLALVIVAELVLGAIYHGRDARTKVVDYKTHSDAFAHSPWVNDYFKEDHRAAI